MISHELENKQNIYIYNETMRIILNTKNLKIEAKDYAHIGKNIYISN